jgi:proteasome component ECM29
VITAFRDPGFFNSVFPMLFEVSNQSAISKTKGSAGTGQSLFWIIHSANDYA